MNIKDIVRKYGLYLFYKDGKEYIIREKMSREETDFFKAHKEEIKQYLRENGRKIDEGEVEE